MLVPRPWLTHESIGKRLAITLWWLAVACAVIVAYPTMGRADTLVAECRVFQRYTIDTSGLPVEFDYQLVAAEANAPMPEGADGQIYTWTFRRDDERILQILVDTSTMEQGTSKYTYTLRPTTIELTDNLYYDISNGRELTYTMEVYTYDKSVPGGPMVQAIIRNPDGTKVIDPGWYVCWDTQSSGSPKKAGSTASTAARNATVAPSGRTSTAQTGDSSSMMFAFIGAVGIMVLLISRLVRKYDL